MDNINAADGDVGIIDLTDDDSDDEVSTTSGFSAPSEGNLLTKSSEPLVLRLHQFQKNKEGIVTAGVDKVKKRKKRRPEPMTDDSSMSAVSIMEQPSNEQFYDARESYHVMSGVNAPGTTPNIPPEVEESKETPELTNVRGQIPTHQTSTISKPTSQP